jgi:hypothetical protein
MYAAGGGRALWCQACHVAAPDFSCLLVIDAAHHMVSTAQAQTQTGRAVLELDVLAFGHTVVLAFGPESSTHTR